MNHVHLSTPWLAGAVALLVSSLPACAAGPDATDPPPDQPRCIPTFEDYDGDGKIAMWEIGKCLKEAGESQMMRDFNDDGVLDRDEVIRYLTRHIQALCGDLDGDGTVNNQDVAILTANIGTSNKYVANFDGDVDLDGDIDQNDLVALNEVLGQSVPVPDMQMLKAYGSMVRDGAKALAAHEGRILESDDHHVYFSSSWPPDHGTLLSSESPRDHDMSITEGWENPAHQTLTSTAWWPPNHLADISEMWDIGNHISGTSKEEWPINHKLQISQQWPNGHSLKVSRSWPTNHLTSNSQAGLPSPHDNIISSSWTHGQDLSAQRYLPNHHVAYTGSWYPSHDFDVSGQTWPPNHFSGPSGTWSDPEDWPANHFEDESREWDLPKPPHRFWPPGHDVSTTITDWLPFLGKSKGPG